MRTPFLALAVVAVLLVSSTGVAGTTQEMAPQGEGQELFEPAEPRLVIHIDLAETGAVHWTIEHRFLLEQGEEAAFRDYGTAVQNGERQVDYSPGIFSSYLADSEAATGREMSIVDAGWEDVRIDSSDDETVGTLAYSFTWEGFARTDGQRIYFGDAFDAPYGTWFGSLGPEQQLVIDPPDGYAFEDAPTGTQNGALVWNGPHQFNEDELDIVLVRTGSVFGFNPTILAGFAVVILVAMIGSYAAAKRRPVGIPTSVVTAIRERIPSTTDPEQEDAATLEYEEGDEGIDVELLSDEERVQRMLHDNGGRMKQATIVKETGWSNAKVSQLLSRMAEDGEIKKLRIGRENLITLPEVDPTELD